MNDSIISDYFLKDIVIAHNNKILRQGQLLLFYIKDFHLHFTIKTSSQTKQFELPYPFEVKKPSHDLLLLDFTLSSFKAEFDDIDRKIKNIGPLKKSRYYNSIIRVYATS
jgi:hypothetical protein